MLSTSATTNVAVGAGRVSVIVPAGQVPAVLAVLVADDGLRAALSSGDGDPLGARVAVMDAVEAKGLEFDVVVLVEPAAILDGGPGDLYVAMTRPTRRLHVVHAQGLPDGLA